MPPSPSPKTPSRSDSDDEKKDLSLPLVDGVPAFTTDAVLPTLSPEEEEKRRKEAVVGGLHRALSSRQVSMISIAGTIGTGLFLGTGGALATGGPGSLLVNYSIVGGLIFLLIHCVGEMVTQFPVAGAWPAYIAKFVDEPAAFAYGWLSVLGLSIAMAGELTATQLLMAYWTDRLMWLPALFFMVGLLGTNLVTVKAYGELEYWLSLLKVIAIVIFFFLGIAVNAGANTTCTHIGAQYWTVNEAPFVDGFAGFASLFVTAAFAYGGTESVGMAAAETKNPTRNISRIANRVFFRIIFFYILTVILIGFDIPYNFPNLASGTTATSPFTIVFDKAGAKAGGSFMNAVILTSILSACNMSLFGSSRVLYGMALRGHAPSIFCRLTKRGVPWAALLAVVSLSFVFFGISFAPGGAAKIWTYAQSLVGVNNQFGWVFIGLSSWRMRRAWIKQGKPLTSLKCPNLAGSYGAPIVVVAFSFIILIQGWSSFKGGFHAEKFVQSYSSPVLTHPSHPSSSTLPLVVEIPVLAVLYFSFRFIKGSRTPSLDELDLVTGEHDDNNEEDVEDNAKVERREGGRLGWAWKVYSWVA
ncbi:hypothetical protein JCM6882_002485 [Rhodosporidiobolus microsporus]